MDLLPRYNEKFSDVNYWDRFFKKRGKKTFEWYGGFAELCSYLFKYMKTNDNILHVGCGNSSLGMELYDAGYKQIKNIDVNEYVINKMKDTNKNLRPELQFEVMDASKMTYADESFNVVLDKGTLDALMPDNSEETIQFISEYFDAIIRVLRNGGRYVCISLLQKHILNNIVAYFATKNFMLRFIRCYEVEFKAKEDDESSLPVFIFVATKCNMLKQKVYEIALTEDQKPVRVPSEREVVDAILSVQQSNLICNVLHEKNISDMGDISIDLYKNYLDKPRFTIFIVDKLTKKTSKIYAAFIVPQGRENDWLFSTREGRQHLLMNTQYDRLAIVILRREHTFDNLQEVQNELSESIQRFAPADLSNHNIPFLSLGDVGKRTIIYEGFSKMSGPYVIEDVEDECCMHRRLIFSNNLFVTQSESRLKVVKSRRGKPKRTIDYGFLSCFHHVYMSVFVNVIVEKKDSSSVLVVGLGGGALCSFLHRCFTKVKLTAVEIDEAMLKVAKDYFGLTLDDRLKVIISDGIKYLEETSFSEDKFDAILFDVDNKDVTVGMSCPPIQFLSESVLNWVASCLHDSGLFVLNLVIRNKSLRPEILEGLKKVFNFVVSYPLQEHVNEIIVCSKQAQDPKQWKNMSQKAAVCLNEQVKKTKLLENEMVNVTELISSLKIE